MNIDIQVPAKLVDIFEPAPYKVLHGGRGGAKSWAIAQALVLAGLQEKQLILCTRELQKSIKVSVHRIISNTIDRMGT